MASSTICGSCTDHSDASPKPSSKVDGEGEALCNRCGDDSGEHRLGSYLNPNRAAVEDLDLTGSAETQKRHTNAERATSTSYPRDVPRWPASDEDGQGSASTPGNDGELAAEVFERRIHASEAEANTSRAVDYQVPQTQQISPRDKRRFEKFQRRWDANMTNESDFDRMLRNGADPIGAPSAQARNREEVDVKATKPAKTRAAAFVNPLHLRAARVEKTIERGKLPRINAGRAVGGGKVPRIGAGSTTGRGKISLSQRPGGEEDASVWDVEVSEDEE